MGSATIGMFALAFPILSTFAAPANSALSDSLTIRVTASISQPHTGTHPVSAVFTGPVELGKATRMTLAQTEGACNFKGERDRDIDGVTDLKWKTIVTPLRVAGDAVTFRIQWSRSTSPAKTLSEPSGDEVVTLKDGASLTLDFVSRIKSERCSAIGTSLEVSVQREPAGWMDARLVEADLWLVEHLPNGKEETQHIVVRTPLHEWASFYFDTMAANSKVADFHGAFMVAPGTGFLKVTLLPKRRLSEPGDPPRPVSDSNSIAHLELRRNDVGAFDMPAITKPDDPLRGRRFSLRVQLRQVR